MFATDVKAKGITPNRCHFQHMIILQYVTTMKAYIRTCTCMYLTLRPHTSKHNNDYTFYTYVPKELIPVVKTLSEQSCGGTGKK